MSCSRKVVWIIVGDYQPKSGQRAKGSIVGSPLRDGLRYNNRTIKSWIISISTSIIINRVRIDSVEIDMIAVLRTVSMEDTLINDILNVVIVVITTCKIVSILNYHALVILNIDQTHRMDLKRQWDRRLHQADIPMHHHQEEKSPTR